MEMAIKKGFDPAVIVGGQLELVVFEEKRIFEDFYTTCKCCIRRNARVIVGMNVPNDRREELFDTWRIWSLLNSKKPPLVNAEIGERWAHSS